MTEELITPEDVLIQPMPVTIHMLANKTFVVNDVNAWKFVDAGVFATGHFKGYNGEVDVIIPYDRVEYYELHYDKLRSFIAAQAQAAQETPDAD